MQFRTCGENDYGGNEKEHTIVKLKNSEFTNNWSLERLCSCVTKDVNPNTVRSVLSEDIRILNAGSTQVGEE